MDNSKQWLRFMQIGSKLGCHQMPERSFFIKGYQFPVCARCAGVIISTVIAIIVFVKVRLPVALCVAMSSVMLIDWGLQYMGICESTNKRRFITGVIGGFGYTTLHLYLYDFIFKEIILSILK